MTGDAITLADYTEVENLVITGPYRGAIYGRDVVDPRLEPVVRIQLSPAVSLLRT